MVPKLECLFICIMYILAISLKQTQKRSDNYWHPIEILVTQLTTLELCCDLVKGLTAVLLANNNLADQNEKGVSASE